VRRAGAALAGVILAATGAARGADENNDIDRLPDGILQAAPPASSDAKNVYLEESLTLWRYHSHLLVPLPGAPQPRWEERASVDAKLGWDLRPDMRLNYSGRMNFIVDDGGPFLTHDNFRHDLREGFVSWNVQPQRYADAGRINLRSGVASGFNPTDFFKTRAVVDRTSNDPAVLRENRLGTVMLRGQGIGAQGAASVAYAPELADARPIFDPSRSIFDPQLDRTNARNRFLLKGNRDLGSDFSPELLLYHEGSRTRFGANIANNIGGDATVYAEWAGGRRATLAEEAFRFGQMTGTLPPNAVPLLPGDRGIKFQNDLAVGASYTTASKQNFALEYDYHQAGFSRADWRNWFDIGQAGAASPAVTGQLWYLRSYALDQQEPLTRHSLFARAAWNDAFVPDLQLAALARIDAYDRSSFVQVTSSYFYSNRVTLMAIASANVGPARSEYGNSLQPYSLVLKAQWYF
jgi:hypothetical protein